MNHHRAVLAAVPLAVSLVALAACSPYTYSKEVADMNTGVKALAASVTQGHQAVLDDQTAHYRRMLILNRSPVVIATNCTLDPPRVRPYVTPTPEEKAARRKAEKEKAAREKAAREKGEATPEDKTADKDPPRQPCDVYLAADNGTSPPDPAPVPPELARAIKALGDYMGALAAVTNAADRTEFDSAFAKLGSSVSAIFAAAGATAPAGALAGAGINLFGWLLGNALDIQRFEALRSGVNRVDRPAGEGGDKAFFVVVKTMAVEVNALASKRREILVADILRERSKLGPGIGEDTYRARLADIGAMAAAIEGLARLNAMSAANDLMKAHDELVEAVNNPRLDIAALVKAVGDLKDKAAALQAALAAASAPPATSKKGS